MVRQAEEAGRVSIPMIVQVLTAGSGLAAEGRLFLFVQGMQSSPAQREQKGQQQRQGQEGAICRMAAHAVLIVFGH